MMFQGFRCPNCGHEAQRCFGKNGSVLSICTCCTYTERRELPKEKNYDDWRMRKRAKRLAV